jgi:hypothetical protein
LRVKSEPSAASRIFMAGSGSCRCPIQAHPGRPGLDLRHPALARDKA